MTYKDLWNLVANGIYLIDAKSRFHIDHRVATIAVNRGMIEGSLPSRKKDRHRDIKRIKIA